MYYFHKVGWINSSEFNCVVSDNTEKIEDLTFYDRARDLQNDASYCVYKFRKQGTARALAKLSQPRLIDVLREIWTNGELSQVLGELVREY